jgi:hypothetical protein
MSSHIAGLVTQTTSQSDTILLAALATAAAAGVVTGALYRIGAAIIASFATVVAVAFIGVGEDWSFWRTALVAFGLITALQLGYLLGVALMLSGDRVRSGVARSWRRIAAPADNRQRKSAGKPPEG